MNDGPSVVSGTFQLNSLIIFFYANFLQAGLPIVLLEINNSTDRLPLLYSAMKHSTSTKAQRDISDVVFFGVFFAFQLMTESNLFFFLNSQQEAMLFCHGAMSLILVLQ